MRSDRILQSMRKVVSHDLPNQVVALQSLLQLLKAEEAARLSPDGREYVRRLHNATQRASAMVRFLKEIARIDANVARTESIPFVALARELQGELQQQQPKIAFEFEWQWQTEALSGDRVTFVRAILELFHCFLQARAGRCRVSATSRTVGDGVELAFFLDEGSITLEEGVTPTPLRWNQHAIEQRIEIILAREWLALSGADVEVAATGGGIQFCIRTPS